MIARMERFIAHDIPPDIDIRVMRQMPALPADLEAHIDVLWARASARVEAGGAGKLFNGRIVSIDAIEPGRIACHLTEYRRHVAQSEDTALFSELGIRSLSACGVLRCADGIAIGRRPPGAVYQPGMWQLCPAGSVDAGVVGEGGVVDCHAQLLLELHEELGLAPDQVGPVTTLCLVEHPGSHVCDLAMTVTTALGAGAVLAAHKAHGNGEYDPLRIVPIAELPAFIERAGAALVPPAPMFLARAGLLPQGFSPPTGP